MKEFITINLQLFAQLVNVTTQDSLSSEMKTYYDKTLIRLASPRLVHDQFAQKRNIPANGGKIIEFRRFEPLPKVTEPLVEGVTPDGKQITVTAQTAEVSQYGDYVTYSDMLKLTTIDPFIVETLKLISQQAGASLDTIVRNKLNAGTNVSYASKVAADGTITEVTDRSELDATCKLTVDGVNRAVAKLRRNNVPTIGDTYVAIVHPDVMFDLMNDKRWIDAHQYTTPENIYRGEVGQIGGVRFVQSTEAKIWKGAEDDTPDGLAVYSCLFLGEDAYGSTSIEGGGLETIIKQLGSAGSADPLDQRATVGWKALKTAEILVEAYMVRLECVSTFSATTAAN